MTIKIKQTRLAMSNQMTTAIPNLIIGLDIHKKN